MKIYVAAAEALRAKKKDRVKLREPSKLMVFTLFTFSRLNGYLYCYNNINWSFNSVEGKASWRGHSQKKRSRMRR
jgi:hypothetical protein